jgi:hypothetical protein
LVLTYICAISVTIHEYCTAESFRAQCQEDEVVVMQHAVYGRMALGRCVTNDFGHLGCKAGKGVAFIYMLLFVSNGCVTILKTFASQSFSDMCLVHDFIRMLPIDYDEMHFAIQLQWVLNI